MTLLKKIKMEKITSKHTKRTLRSTNANKTLHCLEEATTVCSYCRMLLLEVLIVGYGVTRGLSQGETYS